MSALLESRGRTAPVGLGPGVAARPRLVDWIFTAPFLLAFGAALAVFDPLQRIARLFGRPHEIVVGALRARWSARSACAAPGS
jgi:hypothetical protein